MEMLLNFTATENQLLGNNSWRECCCPRAYLWASRVICLAAVGNVTLDLTDLWSNLAWLFLHVKEKESVLFLEASVSFPGHCRGLRNYSSHNTVYGRF